MLIKKPLKNAVIDPAQSWKRRPSEIRGYQRAFYTTTDEGDYIRVDYHLKDRRVRLYVEVDSEGGNAYYSVITKGAITAEKSVSTDRTFSSSDKFRERADIFLTIPNKEVVRLINGNYGIKPGGAAREKPKTEKELRLEETRKKYFKKEDSPGGGPGEEGEGGRTFLSINFFDIIDFLIGIMLSASAYLFFNYSYLVLGITAAFFGIIIGFVDMFIRGRSPVFIKIIFFLLGGAVAYIYGYFM